MKTYILRTPKTVERQNPPPAPAPKPLRGDPAVLALVDKIAGPVLFIGLDVHKDSIAVSLAPSDSTEVRRYGVLGGTHDDVLKLAKKLQAAHPGAELRFCYEAGPTGFPLQRCLRAHGHACIVIAPSRIPRKPGDRIKTDRRDADQLARLYRAGELTAIHVPEPQDEAVRDLLRARYRVVRQQHRARQQLKMFLLRQNIRYAWAERARAAGYPERYAQEALGHASAAIHRACAKSVRVELPPLEEYERDQSKVVALPRIA